MLSVREEIKQKDINACHWLIPEKKIILLTGRTPSEKLVIKPEDTSANRVPNAAQNMRYNLRNMKAVDPFMATRQITGREIQEIVSFLEFQMPILVFDNDDSNENKAIISALRHIGPTSWVKTAKFEGFVDLDTASKSRDNGDKKGVRSIAKALSDAGGLEKFGEILAIDAFNHNHDRFDLSELSGGGKTAQLKRLVNLGNVAICLQNSVLRPIGFDTYSDTSDFRDLSKNERPPREWWGYLLTDAKMQVRRGICEDIADDLETALGPRNRNSVLRALGASDRRLPADAAQRLALGTDSGALKLKTKLLSMSNADKRPPGLQARMVALGWAVQVGGRVQPAPPPGRPPRRPGV